MQNESSPPETFSNSTVFLTAKDVDAKINTTDNDPVMKTIRDCRDAIIKLPDGKRGVVLGSGTNTPKWSNAGWETLDIDKTYNATYTVDANNLSSIFQDHTLDYLLEENLTMSDLIGKEIEITNGTEPAVGFEQLLIESKKVLKEGGVLIMDFIDYGQFSKLFETPSLENYTQAMVKIGFSPTAIIEDPKMYADTQRGLKGGTRIMLYAKRQ